jgi:hypothetical protein
VEFICISDQSSQGTQLAPSVITFTYRLTWLISFPSNSSQQLHNCLGKVDLAYFVYLQNVNTTLAIRARQRTIETSPHGSFYIWLCIFCSFPSC